MRKRLRPLRLPVTRVLRPRPVSPRLRVRPPTDRHLRMPPLIGLHRGPEGRVPAHPDQVRVPPLAPEGPVRPRTSLLRTDRPRPMELPASPLRDPVVLVPVRRVRSLVPVVR